MKLQGFGVIPLAAEWSETATIDLLESARPQASFTTVAAFISWIKQNVEPSTTA
ncbi:hypothetical protein [Dictyobacter arantiisoli]|uniref:Uncharacterized protein n=1 Tax=Dictyobacter arantiisoli TaxID=2014874 RepID=A0A5A5TA19_9CHLR|nr:hypothetical protein [Dictyobacter arantiisoli]GCF08262.1 hypothetical protein KDI_18260 [Dictyobacter arantiisoli]